MNHRKYLALITCGVLLSYSLLILRYYKIQICEGKHWAIEALGQHEYRVKAAIRRGTFFSQMNARSGDQEQVQPLAVDITRFHLCVDAVAIHE